MVSISDIPRTFREQYDPLAPDDIKFIEKGKLCRVTSGPLADLKGIVIESRDQTRLVLQIDMLGQAASVEISTDMIEVIDKNE